MSTEELRSLDECRQRHGRDRPPAGRPAERARAGLAAGRAAQGRRRHLGLRAGARGAGLPQRRGRPARGRSPARRCATSGPRSSPRRARCSGKLRVGFLQPIGTFSHEAARCGSSATRPRWCPGRRSRRSSWRPPAARSTTASCRSRTRSPAASRTRSTRSSTRTCRPAPRSRSRSSSTSPRATSLEAIRKVYSQPVALAQVRNWLSRQPARRRDRRGQLDRARGRAWHGAGRGRGRPRVGGRDLPRPDRRAQHPGRGQQLHPLHGARPAPGLARRARTRPGSSWRSATRPARCTRRCRSSPGAG